MKKRVVIVGGGFAGIEAAKALRHAHHEITLVDRSNHFVFQPLLYQVATGALAPSDIAVPIRWVLRSVPNVTVLEDNVESIDKDQRRVRTGSGSELEYDYLILAAGSRHAYFGHDDWEPYAPGLKTIEDALEVRNRFLAAFEGGGARGDGSRKAGASDNRDRRRWSHGRGACGHHGIDRTRSSEQGFSED